MRSSIAVLAVLGLLACGDPSTLSDPDGGGPGAGGDGTGGSETPDVATITVQGSQVMLWDSGVAVPLDARAFDAAGHEIAFVSFAWSSADEAVATVGPDGVATGIGDGWTQIAAQAEGRTGSASVVVVTPEGPGDRTDCIVCHADDYLRRHGSSGTPETCLRCHSGPTWTGGDFDHGSATGFELLGAHASLGCASCHEADGSPKYPGVADDECIACHQADYDGQHGGSGFPTTCLTCHNRDSFSGASFDHDARFFPVFSGKHQGKWSDCATCHFDATDFGRFTCFACHEHEQARMDDKHSDVSGYAYESSRCYACHPRGEGD